MLASPKHGNMDLVLNTVPTKRYNIHKGTENQKGTHICHLTHELQPSHSLSTSISTYTSWSVSQDDIVQIFITSTHSIPYTPTVSGV